MSKNSSEARILFLKKALANAVQEQRQEPELSQGLSLRELVAQYGASIKPTAAEIEQAIADARNNGIE